MTTSLIILLSSFLLSKAHGASCCGASAQVSAPLTVATYRELTWGHTRRSDLKSIGNDNSGRDLTDRDGIDQSSWTLAIKQSLGQKWQIALTTQFIEREQGPAHSSGLGDPMAQAWYTLSAPSRRTDLKLKVYVGAGISYPLADSVHDYESTSSVSAIGSGHYRYLQSSYFDLQLNDWMIALTQEFVWIPGRGFETVRTENSYEFQGGLSVARSVGDFTLSASLARRYRARQRYEQVSTAPRPKGSLKTTASISSAIMLNEKMRVTLTYLDETLFPARNEQIGRSFGFQFSLVTL